MFCWIGQEWKQEEEYFSFRIYNELLGVKRVSVFLKDVCDSHA